MTSLFRETKFLKLNKRSPKEVLGELRAIQLKKISEQCFSRKKKLARQMSAISEHFHRWPKNVGTYLPAAF